jgi:DsbC/DsbD-like thiol-disulfide interchange protein
MLACGAIRQIFSALILGVSLLLLLCVLLCAASVHADEVRITHGTLELISDDQWITPGQKFNLGLHFQLEKRWHIYWVNPGDSGEPSRVQWQLPSGLSVGDIEWPTPRRLGSSSVADFGYEDAVLLVVPVNADAGIAGQQTVRISATARLLVCSHEMCIPSKADLSLTLPVKSKLPAPNARTADLFAAARKSLPQPAPSNWKFSVTDAHDSFVLTAKLGRPTGGRQNTDHEITEALFYPLIESQIANAAPQKLVTLPGGFQLTLRKSDQLVNPIARLKGVLVLSGEQSYLIDVPVGKQVALRGSFEPASQTVQSLYNP